MTITVSQHESMDGITDKSLLVFHWYLALGCGYKHELIPSGHATSSNCTRPDTINTRPRRRPSIQLETDRRGIEARLYLRPLQVILWFLVHRPHQILFLDFYLIISLLHRPSLAGSAAWDRGYLIIGFLSHYFYYACAEWSMWYKIV